MAEKYRTHLWIALLVGVLFGSTPAAAQDPSTEAESLNKRLRDRELRYRPNWRLEFSNDVFQGSDNFFSAGTSVQSDQRLDRFQRHEVHRVPVAAGRRRTACTGRASAEDHSQPGRLSGTPGLG